MMREKIMFRIPSFYQSEMSFDEAAQVIKSHGRGDMLEGMKAMSRAWDEYLASEGSNNARFEDDDDFYDNYEVEVNAYNVVFKGMSELFAPAS